MKIPHIIKLNIPELIHAAGYLAKKGMLAKTSNHLIYLDIDDAYIQKLFPLLKNKGIKKPDYFSKNSAGAHISVIYPEEGKLINEDDLNREHDFSIKDIVSAEINRKIYYVLLIESPSLLQLRRHYALPDSLSFKGYAIDFHITIGVSA